MNKQKLRSALQAELNRQFEYGAIMYHPDMGGQPMISYPIVYPAPRPVIDLERLADSVLGALALAHATTKTAYAHEYGKSNGDGTFSVVIDRGEPKRPVSDWPITPLYLAPAQAVPGDMVEALRFYANKKNWMAGRWPEDPDEPVENLICIDWQHEEGGSIPFADCGDRARKALAAAPATTQADPTILERNLAFHYLTTHGSAIKRALQRLHDTGPEVADRSYYAHELKALNEVLGS
ncbi:MAG: hypothetical protein EOS07_22015 [Mesorhizobium sp.]|nr:MAG: hypothetical protein EOS07_22015 [Mesorhizobium sp.]